MTDKTRKRISKSFSNFTFIDVETTGGSPHTDRITEIGIIRIENGQKVSEFQSLINPQVHIPHYIQQLTGINQEMVKNAPLFEDIKHEVKNLLADSIFVAHNVTFDYSFIRNEFRRSDDAYRSKVLCTVRLSRALYPEYRKHSLSEIVQRFGLEVENRHRAFDDAQALWEFFRKAQVDKGDAVFSKTIESMINGPRLPAYLRKNGIGPFEDAPGVYTFLGDSLSTGSYQKLYIGKSTSLQKRIHSHFTIGSQSKTDIVLSRYAKDIKSTVTAGNFSAVLLEAHMIKSEKPLLNKALVKNGMYAYLTSCTIDDYKSINIVTDHIPMPNEETEILAAYASAKSMKESLAALCDTYELCPTLMKLTPTTRPCFSYQIEKCRGACVNVEQPLTYNLRFAECFAETRVPRWPFKGAIVFREYSDTLTEYHIFDSWCHRMTVRTDNATKSHTVYPYEFVFDWDIYKIIKKIVAVKSRSLTDISEEEIETYLTSEGSSTWSI